MEIDVSLGEMTSNIDLGKFVQLHIFERFNLN